MKIPSVALAFLLLLLHCPVAVAGQATSPTRSWLDLGLGGGVAGGTYAGAIAAQFSYFPGRHYFGLRIEGMAEDIINGGDETGGVALLYGRGRKGRFGHTAIATGFGGFSCSSFGPDRCDGNQLYPAIPLLAEAAFRANSLVGLGLRSMVMLNTEAPTWNLTLFLQLGWLPR